MGLRQAFARRRGTDGSDVGGEATGSSAVRVPSTATGVAAGVPAGATAGPAAPATTGIERYYTPPPAERRRGRSLVEPPPPYYGAPPVYGPPSERIDGQPGENAAEPAAEPVEERRADVAESDPLEPGPATAEPAANGAPAAEGSAVAETAVAETADAPPRIVPTTGSLVLGHPSRPATAVPRFYAPTPKPYDRSQVRRAFELLDGAADALVRRFYAELFVALGDEALRMFPSAMTDQRADFGRVLVQWVVTDDPDAMATHLAQLGADHRKFDVDPGHYELAGRALVRAWSHLLGDRWTPAIETAVQGSYERLATAMIDGARAREHEPRSWGATVVTHERIGPDFAVVRLQPDAPYPYRPGQYLTVELETQPRLWRRMSIASAPRPDNTFDLHVRAVNATGVSAGLVMHTSAGDRVRLGPPRGVNLVVPPGSVEHGLVCVCSGTGAAPILAVVESLLTAPDRTTAHVFVGARTGGDLHAVERVGRRVRATGRDDHIQLHGVVSDDPSWTGLRGRVEDVAPSLKDWAQLDFDVLVSGPAPMMAATIDGLTARGVPAARIHFDEYDAVD